MIPAASVRVIHKHRIGTTLMTRVSELSYANGKPIAVLSWLHDGDKRVPGFFVTLDAEKLRRGTNRRVLGYTGITVDPRLPPRPSSG